MMSFIKRISNSILFMAIFVLTECPLFAKSDDDNKDFSHPGFRAKIGLYPTPKEIHIHPGEEVVFVLEPTVISPSSLSKTVFHFGDNSEHSFNLTGCEEKRKWGDCKKVYFSHTYRQSGVFQPYIEYEVAENSLAAKTNTYVFNGQITIVPKVKSDEELRSVAFSKMVDELVKGIKKAESFSKIERPKISLSSLRDANFEYSEDNEDWVVIQSLTKALVKKGFSVLERHSQALIRLAHESLVRTNETGNALGDYIDALEYSLTTKYMAPSKPFVYGARIEGVDDRHHETRSGGRIQETTDMAKKAVGAVTGVADGFLQKDGKISLEEKDSSQRYRPFFYAKFDTANFLLVVGVVDDTLEKSEAIYFDTKLKKKMVKRTARVKLEVRMLSRSGEIVWMDGVQGQEEDFILEDLSEKEKKHNIWTKFLGIAKRR